MLFQFGDIIFDAMVAPNSFREEDGAQYATHALLNSKDALQPMGNKLQTIVLDIKLREDFYLGTSVQASEERKQQQKYENNVAAQYISGQINATIKPFTTQDQTPKVTYKKIKKVNVEDIISTLKLQMNTFREGKIIWGNGKVSDVFYIIESMGTARRQMFRDGTLIAADLTITLKEFFIADPIKKIEQNNRDNAKAVGKKSNGPSGKVIPKTCPQLIAGLASTINTYANAIDQLSKNYGLAYNPVRSAAIKGHLAILKTNIIQLETACFDPKSCLYNNDDVKNAADNVQVECNSFTVVLNSFDPTTAPVNVPKENNKLQALMTQLKSVLLPLIKTAVTRNG